MKKILPIITMNSRGILWVSGYKKSSPLFKDLTEDIARNYGYGLDCLT